MPSAETNPAIPKVVYLNQSKFRDAMLSLRQRGGANQRAYEKACSLITGLSYGVEELNKLTNHGESRIKHCRKYDLSNDAHRLVNCIQTVTFIYCMTRGRDQVAMLYSCEPSKFLDVMRENLEWQ